MRALASLLLAAACVLALPVAPAHASKWEELLTGYSLTSWSDDAGRALGSVYAIVQDADGYLWVGADAGLLRFDGSRFTPWNKLGAPAIASGSARSLLRAHDDSLWIGFAQGASVAHVRDGRLTRYAKGLEGLDAVTELAEDGQRVLWAVADRALYRLDGDRFRRVALPWKGPEGQVYHPYVDRDGRLWIGTRWGVFRRDAASGRFDRLSGEHVWGLGEDADGRMWTTDIAAGFRAIDAARPDHGQEGGGYRLTHDRNRHLWLATFGAGLWRVSHDGGALTVRKMVMRSGLLSDTVLAITEDRDGNLWVGTTGGLHRLTERRLSPIDDIGIVLAAAPGGRHGMWVGTSNGLLRLPPASESAERTRVGPGSPDVRVIHTDAQGVAWIGTGDGLWKYDGQRLARIELPGSQQMLVRWLAPDRRGGFWLGDNQWLYLWDGAALRPFEAPPGSPAGTRISFASSDDDGRVWIGFTGGRLGFLDMAGGFHDVGAESGLAPGTHRAIYAVFQDQQHVVWIAGTGGLSRYQNGRVTTLGRANGLPDDRVWSIVDDAGAAIWLNMDHGLVRLERTEVEAALASPARQVRYQAYDTLDGVAGSAVGIVTSSRSDDGTLWFVRGGGLTRVNPRGLAAEASQPPVRATIASVVANDTQIVPAQPGAFPAGTRRLEIQYTAPTLTAANKVRFRYRLDGVDPDWVEAGTSRTASYTNLGPRNYRFHVEAAVEGEATHLPAAEWAFRIEPLFWETRWFYTLMALAAALTLWAAWQARLRLVKREFSLVLAERARLSREIHDTLLQSMVGVALQVDVVSGTLDTSTSTARQQLARMRRQVESYIRDARQSILDLRSLQLETQDLVTALTEFGKAAVADTNIRFAASITGTSGGCSPRIENQLLRIGQEAITNAVRHAHAARVRVELSYEAVSVVLRVSDDGRGFDYARMASGVGHPAGHTVGHTVGHYGLATMRERAEELGGHLSVMTTPGRGSTVIAVVPTRLVAREDMLAEL